MKLRIPFISVVFFLLLWPGLMAQEVVLTNESVKLAGFISNFHAAQNMVLEEMKKMYPGQKDKLAGVQQAFNARHGPSIAAVEKSILRQFGQQQLEQFKAAINKNAVDAMTKERGQYTPELATGFAEAVRKRTDWDMPDQAVIGFLFFTPAYLAQPEKEFSDGYVLTFSTKDNPKAKGLLMEFDYPITWTAQDSEQADAVVIVRNTYKVNNLNFGLSVVKLPLTPDTSNEAQMTEIYDLLYKRITGMFKMKEAARTRVTVSGQSALRTDGHWEQGAEGARLAFQMRHHFIFYKNYRIEVHCMAGTQQGPAAAAKALEGLKPLCGLIMGSIRFM